MVRGEGERRAKKEREIMGKERQERVHYCKIVHMQVTS